MASSSQPTVPQADSISTPLFTEPNETGTPERRLLTAILERAILDYVGNNHREVSEAEEWLFDSEEKTEDTFSFEWVCQQLDLDSGMIATQIRAMPKRGERRIAPWYFSSTKSAQSKRAA